jgi:hypothetical protein
MDGEVKANARVTVCVSLQWPSTTAVHLSADRHAHDAEGYIFTQIESNCVRRFNL